MTDSKTYQDLEAALIKAAMGYDYEEQSMTQTTEIMDGNKISTQSGTLNKNKVLANPALIEKILSERIGGPQDWC